MDNWSPRFKIVDAFHLTIAANDKAGLELIEGTIRKKRLRLKTHFEGRILTPRGRLTKVQALMSGCLRVSSSVRMALKYLDMKGPVRTSW